MLSGQIKEWEREMPEGIHKENGACRFCGQLRMFHTIFPWGQDECNEAATELCECTQAVIYTKRKSRKEKVIKAIEEKFGENAKNPVPEVAAVMMAAVEPIVNRKIDSVAIKDGKVKYKLSMTSKDTVKVEQTVTNNNSMEV